MSAKPSFSTSPKSALTALLLCMFLGTFGVHRFYVGKVKTGVLMLVTLGGFGIWTLVDLILIDCCEFSDDESRVLRFETGSDTRVNLMLRILALPFGVLPLYAGLAVMTALLAGSGLTLTSPAMNQLAAIRVGDLEKAYSYTSSGFQEQTKPDTFKAFINAYPVIKNNVRATFSTTEVDKDQGYLKGKIYDKSGATIEIEYQLIYEGDAWKILGLRVDPGQSSALQKEEDNEKSAASEPAPVEKPSTKNLTYDDKAGKYTIKYPDNWMYENTDATSVMFSGSKGTPAYASTITIQTLPMKKAGGVYKDAKGIVGDLKKQINAKTMNVKFGREGEAELPTNPKAFKGYYFEVSYVYRNVPIKKMQFIIVNPSGTIGYSWGYTTDAARYDKDLPVAKAMYESWAIQK